MLSFAGSSHLGQMSLQYAHIPDQLYHFTFLSNYNRNP